MRMPDLTLLGFEQELARAAAERRKADEAEPAS